MARATGAHAQLLGAFEAAYGNAPGGNFHTLPFVSCDIGSQQPLEASDVLGLGRDPAPPSRDVITAEGQITVPVDLRSIGFWLKGLFGPPVTTGTGPYNHVYTSGADTLPSLALEVGHPQVPRYFLNLGCLVNSLNLGWAPSGKANATLALIAQGETDAATSSGGTPTTQGLQRFHQFQGRIRKDGAALANITAAELTYANNLDPVRVIRDDGKIEGADLGVASCTGNLAARFADMVLLDAATDGTAMALEFAWVIDADRSLTIALPSVFLPKPRIPISGPAGIEARFDWQAAKPDIVAPGGAFVTVTLKNDIASY